MSKTEDTDQRSASAQAVDEEYKKLERFHVERRRVVLVDDNDAPEGGFGIVRRGELYQSAYLPAWLASRQYGPPQAVAVKQIKVSAISNVPRVKRAFTREMSVWSSLEAHPGIAKFLGFYADFKRSEAWLLSPWEPNGNVCEFIKTHDLEVPEKLSLIYDTIDALTFLHRLDTPANVLVTAEYRARLCDFGLARMYEDSGFGRLETSTGMKGSIRWCSPEILKDAPRTPSSDVYAWAWLVWEIMTGDVPYQGTSADYAIIYKIFESPLPQVDGKSRLSDCLQVWELLRRCWNVDPLQRPTSMMCKTTVTYLPRCTPSPANANHQTRSPVLLENLGDLESWKGNRETSSAYLDEALQLYQEEMDMKGIAGILLKQARAAFRITDYFKLRAVATTALERCRSLNDALGIAEASYYLGYAVDMLSVDGALPLLQESLDIRRAHGDDVGIVQCLERIGYIQTFRGQGQEGLSTLLEAVEIASRSGDRLGLATALQSVGSTHLELSDFIKAAEALSEALMITRSVGWDVEIGHNLLYMGRLKTGLGEYREAEEFLQDSISIFRCVRDWWCLPQALESLGDCFQEQSRPNDAASLFEEATLLWLQQSRPEDSKDLARYLVELKSGQGDWNGALRWHDHIIAVCHSQKLQLEVTEHLLHKGEILVNLQRHDEAALHFEAAMAICIENGHPWSQERVQLCAIPKTAMKWERRLPLMCNLKKLQRRQPQLVTASLKLPILVEYSGS
ncbi:hypothetical protein M407DRAFT_23253 [Tulasnella calospora MUT 4182]|uniref:Protein kinase domain-containing protein n=1 Tax=Tulasnella calospora MUT 4182 TaxID=1051891 RepID=A0A0C3QB05_9AGAM|nr:hypothetical protein M407DRAFT_23253 [Tulasnella calospora MUT 4182]